MMIGFKLNVRKKQEAGPTGNEAQAATEEVEAVNGNRES